MSARVDYRDRKILVMGLGLSGGGVGIARFLASRGAKVTVTDLLDARQLSPSIDALKDLPINFVLGEHREPDFRRADMVVRNPAVPRNSQYLRSAQEAGVPVEMEMGLFFAEWPPAKTIGVTGTRGKTTTATFIHHLLRKAGIDAALAGNMRASAVALLDTLLPHQTVVLELSSWQLEGLVQHKISPAVAVVTNVLPDHLNRYDDMDDYAKAKATIVLHQSSQDLAVLNRENVYCRSLAAKTRAQVRWFSGSDTIPAWDAAPLKGEHNRANLAAGIQATKKFAISEDAVAGAVRTFAGVPFRQELVRAASGIRFINDTTATSPDATLAALATVSGPILLIAGGSDKGLSFSSLAARLDRLGEGLRGIVLLPGTGTDALAPLLPLAKTHRAPDMEQAVRIAVSMARPGDAVLLSPACASFGLFANEFDRGEQFNQVVASLE